MHTLTLTDLVPVSDQDKADAARIKAEANKAFTSVCSSTVFLNLGSLFLRLFQVTTLLLQLNSIPTLLRRTRMSPHCGVTVPMPG